jgi:hypothetical protein
MFRIMVISAVTARMLQAVVRVRSGQAPAWPLVSDRSVRRGSRVKRDFACTSCQHVPPRAGSPAVTVTLEAGGTDTYTQRATAGPQPRQDQERRFQAWPTVAG